MSDSRASGEPPLGRRLLSVRRLSKTFPGTRALHNVSFDLHTGEVVAVVGQNGSGKSTLVKLLAGVHRADPGGEVLVGDATEGLVPASDARDRLHFVHQNLGLIPSLNTIENLDLSRRLGSGWLRPLNLRKERARAVEMLQSFDTTLDVDVPVAELTPAQRAVVAITRALDGWTRNDNVLVLDEPTAALHGEEVGALFTAIRRVAHQGAGVIFISHRLDEVIDLADRVVALRDGEIVAIIDGRDIDNNRLVELIARGDLPELSGARTSDVEAEPVLQVRDLRADRVNGVDLEIAAGEVVGVSGLLGSGCEQLAGAVFGSVGRLGGEVRIRGLSVPGSSPSRAVKAGMAFVPSDRARDGAVLSMSARENLTLAELSSLQGVLGHLSRRSERIEVQSWFAKVGARPVDPERPLALFSGGNQQKVVLAKWLRTAPSVLLLDEPTQGVDVGAKASIYELIIGAARAGAAVLVSSSDSTELAALCSRILVLRDGRVAAQIKPDSLTEARLIRESLGLTEAQTSTVLGAAQEESHV
jgi:ABC-type sugar transport system ATPase subunit